MRSTLTTGESGRKPSYLRWYLFLASLIAVFVAGPILLPFVRLAVLHPTANFHGFIAGGNSMCPTICEGERFLADMNAYTRARPRIGDVVLLYQHNLQSLLMKRIVATEGETVTYSPKHGLLVNGQEFSWPPPCGSRELPDDVFADAEVFAPVTVGKDEVFVVGDNLDDSFDSRISGFGPARLNDIAGKVLVIYLSPKLSRIGCEVK